MLDAIYRTFEERLCSFWHDIFVREAFLAVGIGISMDSQLKSDYFGPYLVVALQNQVFK